MAELHFGVGSFYFRAQESFEGSISDYMKLLKAALESKNNITNVRCSGFGASLSRYRRFSRYFGDDVGNMIGADMLPVTSELAFDVFIPIEAQRRLERSLSIPHSELFTVRSIFPYGPPCTIISSKSCPEAEVGASQLVPLVFKFLEQEFPKGSGPISVERIGPSPMHIHFYAESGEYTEWKAELVRSSRGYDQCTIQVPEDRLSAFESLEDAVGVYLAEQVSHYYSLVQHINVRDEIIQRLDDSVETIIGGLSQGSVVARVLNLGGRTAATFAAERMCYDLAFLDEEIKNLNEEESERLSIDTSSVVLAPLFQQRIRESLLTPASFRSILDAARQANTIELQVRMAVLAAIVGGLCGALASAAIGGT